MKVILIFLVVFAEVFGLNIDFLDSDSFFDIGGEQEVKSYRTQLKPNKISSYPVEADGFYKPTINVKSYLSFDYDSQKVLSKKKINKKRSIASLTKLMTAIVAIENMDLEDNIKVPKSVNKITGSKVWIEAGLNFKTKDLLKAMLVKSANDCAHTISAAYNKKSKDKFKQKMNQKAQELNMNDSQFKEATGLSEKNISTASDLKKLATYALRFETIREYVKTYKTTIKSNEGYTYPITSTNRMLRDYADIYGLKTGYLQEAGQCFIAASNKNDHRVVSIVLGADDNNLRFWETRKLLDWSFDNYYW